MAKTYKRKYRKRYSINKLLRNYYKAKLDYLIRIKYQQSGVMFIEWNTNAKPLADLIAACKDWDYYKRLFHSFKLTGVSLEISPGVPQGNFVSNGALVLGLITSADPTDFSTVVDSTKSIVLSTTNTQRRYISFNGGQTGWSSTNLNAVIDGKLFCETDSLPESGVMVWGVKVSFYITFKNSS